MTFPLSTLRSLSIGALLCGTTIALISNAQTTKRTPAQLQPTSIQQTMDLLIDPAADSLWDSVGTEETAHGTHEKQPHTPAEWQTVAEHAQAIIAGAKRLQTPGLPVGANAHSKLADADTPGTRTAAQIRVDIDANPAKFRAAAIRLETTANHALTATKTHNPAGVIAAGAELDAACEACHAAYWYPRTPPQHLPSPAEFAAGSSHP
jgi:cytochrome c556